MRELNSEPENNTPEMEIERLKKELRRQNELYLRAIADCDNYRKRVERDQAKAARDSKKDLLLGIIEVLDEFERALNHAEKRPETLLDGIQIIYRLLKNRVVAEGVTPVFSRGEMFNPIYHDAAGTVADSTHAPGTVVEELRTGYRWKDGEVLRPARVLVAREPE